MNPADALLEIEDLHVTIQSMEALRGFSLAIAPREMTGLIGRNGAGKTTLMRAIMGHLPPVRGALRFAGEDLSTVARHARAARGIGYMPEDRQLVPELTVEENILLPTWVTRSLNGPERLAFVYEIMPEVAEMRGRKALLLSGGQQKLVALCRALTVGTRLLLLDETFEGVAPALSQRLSEVIAGLKGTDLAVLITPSELNHSRTLFDHEYVIERGVAGEVRSAA